MKFKRVFVQNPSFRLDAKQLSQVAGEIVYVCDKPMFDNLIDEKYMPIYEGSVVERMSDFDPENDIIAYYGDSIIFAMMIMYLTETFYEFHIARFSTIQQTYVIRKICSDNLQPKEEGLGN